MDFQKKLRKQGIIMFSISIIAAILLFAVWGKSKMNHPWGWWLLIIGLIPFIGQQVGTWIILYRFAVTRKRMSNKLHLFNRISALITIILSSLMVLMAKLYDVPITDSSNIFRGLLVLVLLGLYIFYQENNTNNLIVLNLYKKLKQSKKEYNQMIGFLTGWTGVNLLWLTLFAGISLNFMTFFYIVLILIQNALSYTTYGQSKQWNFTYEIIGVGHLVSLGFSSSSIVIIVIGLSVGLILCIRQWIGNGYLLRAKLSGIFIYIVLGSTMVLSSTVLMKNWVLIQGSLNVTEIIPYVFILFLVTFSLTFVINEPRFLKNLSTK